MSKDTVKTKVINWVLWGAFILALLSSVNHLAYTFGTVESLKVMGWISALAVDAGLAALAYTIQQRKRAKRATRSLWWGVAGFATISALANFYHALSVESGGAVAANSLLSADWLELAKAVILSATLPAMVIYLGEIVSGDDAKVADDSKREVDRQAAQAEREQRRVDQVAERELLEAKIRVLEAERAAALVAQPAETSAAGSLPNEPAAATCEDCGRSFATVNALNAHMRTHSLNGHRAESK